MCSDSFWADESIWGDRCRCGWKSGRICTVCRNSQELCDDRARCVYQSRPQKGTEDTDKFLCLLCLLWLRFVGDFEFLDRDAVAPDAHEALLSGVAEGVGAVLAGEGGV